MYLFLEKVSVAVISSGVLALLLTIDYLAGYKDIGMNFLPWFFVYFIYAAPVYLIGGGLYSLGADLFIGLDWFRNRYLNYFLGLAVYAAGGILVMGLYMLLLWSEGSINWSELFSSSLFGVLAALIFYHVLLVWRKIRK